MFFHIDPLVKTI